MLADPKFAAELDDLKKDAPPGQGPFLSAMSHLRRDPKPSERQEAGVAALATNPVPREVPDVPGTKVVLNAPPVENPEAQQARRLQVTQPDIKKKEQLGLPTDLDFEGRSLAGTLKFKKPPLNPTAEVAPSVEVAPTNELTTELAPRAEPGPPPIVAPTGEDTSPQKQGRPWLWIGVILLSIVGAAMAAIAISRSNTGAPAPSEVGNRSGPATATATVAETAARLATESTASTREATPLPLESGTSTRTVVSDATGTTARSSHEKPTASPSVASTEKTASPAATTAEPRTSTTAPAPPVSSPAPRPPPTSDRMPEPQ